MEPLTGEYFYPINDYPKIMNDIDQWDMENDGEMRKIFEITKIRPTSGSRPINLIDGKYLAVLRVMEVILMEKHMISLKKLT